MEANRTAESVTKKNKAVRRRLRVLVAVMLCMVGWAAVTVWDQLETLHAKSEKLGELELILQDAKLRNEQYTREKARLSDPEYIEQRIMKELQMTREGETLFITPKTR